MLPFIDNTTSRAHGTHPELVHQTFDAGQATRAATRSRAVLHASRTSAIPSLRRRPED